ncbi:MAG: hypothetical protein FJX84_02650 [Bacteroidetes bacterium]|nr:hypothetical protein [Bacteroidota bacterium]
MKKLSYLVLLLLTVIFLDSCSIVKRRYSPGYTVVWNAKSKTKKLKSSVELSNKKESITKNEVNSVANEVEKNPSLTRNFSENKEETLYTSYINTSENDFASLNTDNTFSVRKMSKDNYSQNLIEKPSSNVETSKSISSKVTKNPVKFVKDKLKQKSNGGDEEMIIGILLCLFGLAPFGVRYAKGKNSSAYKTNLMIWLAGWGCLLIGIITAVLMATGGSVSFLGLALYGIGGLLLFISFIHGLISILR